MQQATIVCGNSHESSQERWVRSRLRVRDQLMYAALNLPEPIFSTRSLVAMPARLGKVPFESSERFTHPV